MVVILEGQFTVPEERRAEVLEALEVHKTLSRAEPGCLHFNVEEDLNVRGAFHVSEAFVDKAAFEAHQRRGQASDWARVSAGLPRDYHIEGLE